MNSVHVRLFGRFLLFLLWEPAWKLHSRGLNSHSTFKGILSPLLLTFLLKHPSIFSFLLVLGPCGRQLTLKRTDSPLQQQLALHYYAYLLVFVCVQVLAFCSCYHLGIQQRYESCQNAYQTCQRPSFSPQNKGPSRQRGNRALIKEPILCFRIQ